MDSLPLQTKDQPSSTTIYCSSIRHSRHPNHRWHGLRQQQRSQIHRRSNESQRPPTQTKHGKPLPQRRRTRPLQRRRIRKSSPLPQSIRVEEHQQTNQWRRQRSRQQPASRVGQSTRPTGRWQRWRKGRRVQSAVAEATAAVWG